MIDQWLNKRNGTSKAQVAVKNQKCIYYWNETFTERMTKLFKELEVLREGSKNFEKALLAFGGVCCSWDASRPISRHGVRTLNVVGIFKVFFIVYWRCIVKHGRLNLQVDDDIPAMLRPGADRKTASFELVVNKARNFWKLHRNGLALKCGDLEHKIT